MLKTYVIASGMLYGNGEYVFHKLFRTAWELRVHALPVYGNGSNFLPCIHVSDLANVALFASEGSIEQKYIVAVDEAQQTLQQITECISVNLGTGKTRNVPEAEAVLDGMDQLFIDMLSIDQMFEMGCISELEFEVIQSVRGS